MGHPPSSDQPFIALSFQALGITIGAGPLSLSSPTSTSSSKEKTANKNILP